MKKIVLIRHAESEANVGDKILPHDNIIKITQNGKKQSEELVEVLEKPDRIILSKFIRTIETAEPTIKKYPETEVHLWLEVHEFDPADNTVLDFPSFQDFKVRYDLYWQKLDPDYKDAEHVESFREFVIRINKAILKAKNIPDGINYVFTHGWCIKMFYVLLRDFVDYNKVSNSDPEIYKKIMTRFVAFDKEFKSKNTGQYDISELVENYLA